MKLSIIGSRGFLVEYGGYETFVKRLVLELKNKYEIMVYGIVNHRNSNFDKLYPEIKRVWLPTIQLRFLEKVVCSFLSVIHCCLSKSDIVLSISVSPGLLLFVPRLSGKKVIVNPDGLEWQRPKWSSFIKFWLRLSEWLAAASSDIIIADFRGNCKVHKDKI